MPQGGPAPEILTSTTILADVTRNIVGERLSVGSLLPVGADPHSYQLTPQDTARISKSKVLILNGAGYERFLETALANADGKRTLIEASTGLRLRSDTTHGQGTDPHLWLDPNNMIVYVQNIRDGLIQFDPAGADTYRANAQAYIQQLKNLDTWINEQVTQLPPSRKLLVTNHEAFGYFAERYGFRVVGTVIESFSSDASPSAQQMAALVDQIKGTMTSGQMQAISDMKLTRQDVMGAVQGQALTTSDAQKSGNQRQSSGGFGGPPPGGGDMGGIIAGGGPGFGSSVGASQAATPQAAGSDQAPGDLIDALIEYLKGKASS